MIQMDGLFEHNDTDTVVAPPGYRDPLLASQSNNEALPIPPDTVHSTVVLIPINECKEKITLASPLISMFGEMFEVVADEGYVILSHPAWSLTGLGKDFVEAEKDLVENARILANVYLNRPVSQMTIGALEFRDFLLQII